MKTAPSEPISGQLVNQWSLVGRLMKDNCVCMHGHVCACVFYMLTSKEQLREHVCHEGLKTYNV
jgi:hypothetical protein